MHFWRLTALCLCLWSPQAFAGFQWVAPASNNTQEKLEAPDKSQPGQNLTPEQMIKRIFRYESGDLSTREMDEQRTKYLKQAAEDAAENKPAMGAYREPENQVSKTLPKDSIALEAIPLNPQEKPTIGFGADVPLAMAVSDIVPSRYSVSFDKDINPGVLISWQGLHRPWQIVLAETLGRYRMVGSVKDNAITVHRLSADTTPLPINPMMASPGQTLILDPMPAPQKSKILLL